MAAYNWQSRRCRSVRSVIQVSVAQCHDRTAWSYNLNLLPRPKQVQAPSSNRTNTTSPINTHPSSRCIPHSPPPLQNHVIQSRRSQPLHSCNIWWCHWNACCRVETLLWCILLHCRSILFRYFLYSLPCPPFPFLTHLRFPVKYAQVSNTKGNHVHSPTIAQHPTNFQAHNIPTSHMGLHIAPPPMVSIPPFAISFCCG